jgi:Polyketide cyclase / dehydrase and lipid transport
MMEVEVTTVVDRPVATVWNFVALNHVQNHPRWDPDIELDQITEGPIGLGTVIKRRNTRYETPTEGTMEVVEFEPEKVMGSKIHDGAIETNGRVTLVAEDQDRTAITLWAEFPGMDESMAERIAPLMQRSAQTIKRLIESET